MVACAGFFFAGVSKSCWMTYSKCMGYYELHVVVCLLRPTKIFGINEIVCVTQAAYKLRASTKVHVAALTSSLGGVSKSSLHDVLRGRPFLQDLKT